MDCAGKAAFVENMIFTRDEFITDHKWSRSIDLCLNVGNFSLIGMVHHASLDVVTCFFLDSPWDVVAIPIVLGLALQVVKWRVKGQDFVE